MHKLTQVCLYILHTCVMHFFVIQYIKKGGEFMSGKTSNESKRKYNEKAYDRIQLVVKKGKKEEIKAYAEEHGYSLNSFVIEAIDEKMQNPAHKESENNE